MSDLSHRRAACRIRVLHPDGSPAAHARIRFDQLSHDFLFGCGGFEAVELAEDTDDARKAFLEDRMGQGKIHLDGGDRVLQLT